MSPYCRKVLLSRVESGMDLIRGEAQREGGDFDPGPAVSVTGAFLSEVDTGSRKENASKNQVIALSWESVRCAHGK
jgi:hypothetical protein